ncbi:MAG: hypothetical protein ACLRWQ_04850 [Flavonifractor plautii]
MAEWILMSSLLIVIKAGRGPLFRGGMACGCGTPCGCWCSCAFWCRARCSRPD